METRVNNTLNGYEESFYSGMANNNNKSELVVCYCV